MLRANEMFRQTNLSSHSQMYPSVSLFLLGLSGSVQAILLRLIVKVILDADYMEKLFGSHFATCKVHAWFCLVAADLTRQRFLQKYTESTLQAKFPFRTWEALYCIRKYHVWYLCRTKKPDGNSTNFMLGKASETCKLWLSLRQILHHKSMHNFADLAVSAKSSSPSISFVRTERNGPFVCSRISANFSPLSSPKAPPE